MSRILAIDYGRKRSGVAVTDPMQLIANSLDTIESYKLIDFLKAYFEKEDVEMVVIGYPKQMNNMPSEAVRYINEFISKFVKVFPGRKYDLMDERFTSRMAFQSMIDGGVKKKKRQDKALIDKISATIILQSYMEMKNNLSNYTS
ncbi:MAG: Holliday junction resolvase RuvX [Bacteroidales bacterium]|nr:Holliday junction resolvase RuvX [Bacteroidales bacterium]